MAQLTARVSGDGALVLQARRPRAVASDAELVEVVVFGMVSGITGPSEVTPLTTYRNFCRQVFRLAGVQLPPDDATLDGLIYEACWYHDKKIDPPVPLETFLDIASEGG